MKKFILLISILTFLVACKDDPTDPDTFREEVLFARDYENNAWGYKHDGLIIQKNGDVKGYNAPDNWVVPDRSGYMSEEDLLSNFSDTYNPFYHGSINVPKDTLEKYYSYIADIESNLMGEIVSQGADMGYTRYYCYRWDETQKEYKCILIGIRGNAEQYNQSEYSMKVINWLENYYMATMIEE